VLETARWWAQFSPGEQHGNLAQWHPVPKVIEHAPEASTLLRAFRQQADDQYSTAEGKGDRVGIAIWARAHEKACRLALVYACSANRLDLKIDVDAVRWATALIEHQTKRMLFMAAEHVAENEHDKLCKALVVTLREWRAEHGDEWMPYWRINRKHPWTERQHEDVRATLLAQQVIEYELTKTSNRPGKLYRLAVPTQA
jgi:hypothetical protein